MANNNLFLEGFFQSLDKWGITDILLPFLLVFVLIFSVLEKTKVLGADKKNFNVVIALIMGFSVVIPHVTNSYPINFDPVELINGILPQVSILVVALMMLLILIGVFAHDKVLLGIAIPGWIAFFSIVAVIFIFGSSAGWWGGSAIDGLESFFGEDAISIAVMVLVFGIIIAFITSDSKDKTGVWERLGVNFKEMFGKS